MPPKTDFPPVRACIFDMDGLLLDTEDLYTQCINLVLQKYDRPNLPGPSRGLPPGAEATRLFQAWANLPVDEAEYLAEVSAHQRRLFPTTTPLPGVEKLLSDLGRTRYWDLKKGPDAKGRVHIALATSSHESNFKLKTTHLTELFSVFDANRQVLGDDPRIEPGRGKPLPDIFLLALRTINESLPDGEPPVKPEECLVFEDSVPGVEAGRRAGMRVIWVPHEGLLSEYAGREAEVLAGRTGQAGDVDLHQLGEIDDGWAERLPSLENFPYEKYGIAVPDPAVEQEESMRRDGANGEVIAQRVV
ncbi:hypothetical protein jhhlp_007739 [Lomentospora prolificans]|uniref:Uncharacterized protein n=1 Tax=Lomentospora prolificans TaxID=41688 RepID=A0A2N3N0E7_9PEZI|nr:hypothetical protein jhhlp_007739 [Lomentospora prolificans]